MSFGKAFGALVKTLRGVEGLTQQQLAEKAFGDSAFKTRISELENGRIKNPHAKTVDALVVALNIPSEEIGKLLVSSPEKKVFDSYLDFFELGKREALNTEVAVNAVGEAVFFHDLKLKAELKRTEFFIEERQFILVAKGGIVRRPSALPLGRDVAMYLSKCESILFVRLDADTGEAIRGERLPLKIIY